MRRLIMALAALAAVLVTAPPAHARAGFWAVTELDPLPATLRPGVSYTVGYWVLQHGTHPYDDNGALGPTGLLLTGEDGTSLSFGGTPLPDPAHYATTITVPAGRWRVQGVQGKFAPYEVGTLTVPGTLKPAPPQYAMQAGAEITDYWGRVKPPGFPWKAATVIPARAPFATPPGSSPEQQAGQATAQAAGQAGLAPPSSQPAAMRASGAAAADDGGSPPWRQPYALVVVALAAVAGTLLVQRAARAARAAGRREPVDPPEREAREGEEVIGLG
ncbi:hypothetical protein [Microbispora triticiradicis]|uniref:Uncharacterized protein n=2 Tax=Microbispora TaxID=2005 RepID=A0ABY3M0H1_9ACTN|nr:MULTISPECIES: hypothetical protein [Microbispora]TLP62380.1 hypothetical protein FED44_10560 [Microbispora fusca]TYB62412.1 hypothetical protein FXF59_10265 [Microbispora tritici]